VWSYVGEGYSEHAVGSVGEDVAMAIPEADLDRIELWCRTRVPEQL
jgi:hypothetical protein